MTPREVDACERFESPAALPSALNFPNTSRAASWCVSRDTSLPTTRTSCAPSTTFHRRYASTVHEGQAHAKPDQEAFHVNR